MTDPAEPRIALPKFESTTRLFARALGWSADELLQRFRVADADDEAALLAFRARDGWDDRAYLRWRYGASRDVQADPPGQSWIVRHGDGPVLAAIGTEAQPIHHAGRVYRGQLLMDVQLDPALEGAGGGVWLNQAMFRRAEASLAVGGNVNSMGMVRRLFAPLPSRRHYVLPLKTNGLLQRRRVPAAVAGIAAPILDAGLRLRTAVLAPADRQNVRVQEVDRVSESWLRPLHDALAPGIACIAPDAGQLQWRLRDNPRASYRIFVAHRDGHCVGYLAARVVAATPQDEGGLHIQDWKVAEADATPALATLLSHAVEHARKHACSRVFTTCLAPHADATLRRCGFLPGRSAPHLLTGIHTDLPLPVHPQSNDWQITDLSFDGDGGY